MSGDVGGRLGSHATHRKTTDGLTGYAHLPELTTQHIALIPGENTFQH